MKQPSQDPDENLSHFPLQWTDSPIYKETNSKKVRSLSGTIFNTKLWLSPIENMRQIVPTVGTDLRKYVYF